MRRALEQHEDTYIIQPDPATSDAFQAYVHAAENVMQITLHPTGRFLWCEENDKREHQVLKGGVEAQLWSGDKTLSVPHGLIHDWVGAVFAPNATVTQTLALVQNYDNHKNIYKPEVMELEPADPPLTISTSSSGC